jgi:hypothetical protein
MQNLQDFFDVNEPKGLRVHFSSGMVGEQAAGKAPLDFRIGHLRARL